MNFRGVSSFFLGYLRLEIWKTGSSWIRKGTIFSWFLFVPQRYFSKIFFTVIDNDSLCHCATCELQHFFEVKESTKERPWVGSNHQPFDQQSNALTDCATETDDSGHGWRCIQLQAWVHAARIYMYIRVRENLPSGPVWTWSCVVGIEPRYSSVFKSLHYKRQFIKFILRDSREYRWAQKYCMLHT